MKPWRDKAQATALAQTIVMWCEAMNSRPEPRVGPFAMLDRGDRAQLRRCETPDDVMLQSAYHRLLQELARQDVRIDANMLALAAGVLVHAEHVPNKEFAVSLGQRSATGRIAMSELRFRKLQTCRDEESFFRQARRAVALLGGGVDIGRLALDLLQWMHEFRCAGPASPPEQRLKLRWAADYYHAALRDANQEPT